MDQEEIYSEDTQTPEGDYTQEYEPVSVAPPLEGTFSNVSFFTSFIIGVQNYQIKFVVLNRRLYICYNY